MSRRGIQSSNLGHSSRRGRLMAAPTGDGGDVTHRAVAPWPLLWRAFLDEVYPYGGGAGRWTHLRGSSATTATVAVCAIGYTSSSSSAALKASFGGAPARPRPPAASPWSPQAPPRLQLRRAVVKIGARQRWLGQRRWLSLGPKYAWYRALFIGVFG
jgi:hypothetical protein